MALNDKQLKFCTEYAKHGNAMKAYGVAYPDAAPNSVKSNANRLMENDGVLKKVDELRKETVTDTKITRERVAKELAEMGFSGVDITNLKHGDKLKALEMLSKMLGFLDGPGSDKADQGDVDNQLLGSIGRLRSRVQKREDKP